MKHTKRFLLTLAAMIGMTGAWAQDEVTVNPTANANEWTLEMPDADVELEVTYYTDEELAEMEEAAFTAGVELTKATNGEWSLAEMPAFDIELEVTYYTDEEVAEMEEAAFTAGVELTKASNGEWSLAEMPGFDIELEVEYETALALNEVDDNTEKLAEWNGYEADVTLTRTLVAGGWNTLAVPFNADAASLGLSAAKELESATLENYVLTLNFTDAAVIEAGKPYLVKVAENVENPTIAGVIVSKEAVPFTSTNVDFIPTLGATTITGDNSKEVLFLASENKLKNPTELPADIKGFRAYFQLKGEGAQVKAFQLNLGDGETTGIQTIDNGQLIMDNEVYDLQGRRVNKAAQKGVYIVNGKKTIIK